MSLRKKGNRSRATELANVSERSPSGLVKDLFYGGGAYGCVPKKLLSLFKDLGMGMVMNEFLFHAGWHNVTGLRVSQRAISDVSGMNRHVVLASIEKLRQIGVIGHSTVKRRGSTDLWWVDVSRVCSFQAWRNKDSKGYDSWISEFNLTGVCKETTEITRTERIDFIESRKGVVELTESEVAESGPHVGHLVFRDTTVINKHLSNTEVISSSLNLSISGIQKKGSRNSFLETSSKKTGAGASAVDISEWETTAITALKDQSGMLIYKDGVPACQICPVLAPPRASKSANDSLPTLYAETALKREVPLSAPRQDFGPREDGYVDFEELQTTTPLYKENEDLSGPHVGQSSESEYEIDTESGPHVGHLDIEVESKPKRGKSKSGPHVGHLKTEKPPKAKRQTKYDLLSPGQKLMYADLKAVYAEYNDKHSIVPHRAFTPADWHKISASLVELTSKICNLFDAWKLGNVFGLGDWDVDSQFSRGGNYYKKFLEEIDLILENGDAFNKKYWTDNRVSLNSHVRNFDKINNSLYARHTKNTEPTRGYAGYSR